jgi:ADP-ribose pyrophosphatase
MMDDDLMWKPVDETVSLVTPVFRVLTRRMQSPDNKIVDDFYILDAPDWVNVVAVTARGEFILVNQYRFGTGKLSLEVPGGVVDQGETHREAAERELLEETGYIASEWRQLGVLAPNPALNTNTCGIWLATGCTFLENGGHDHSEFIRVEHLSRQEAVQAIADGTIHHALAVAALGMYLVGL